MACDEILYKNKKIYYSKCFLNDLTQFQGVHFVFGYYQRWQVGCSENVTKIVLEKLKL